MKRFYLKNLDCSKCAATIEEHVRKLGGVRFVSVNSATGMLHLDADDNEAVFEEIKQIEPKVEIVDSKAELEGDISGKLAWGRGLTVITFSSILFILGLIFRRELHSTPYMAGEFAVFVSAYLLCGNRVLYNAMRNIRYGRIFDEYFLMSVATLGAIAIHEMPEAVGVMLFYRVGEYFQELSLSRSRASIKSLLQIRPEYANVKADGEIKKVSPEEVQTGSTIVIKPGEKVPLDGEISKGISQVDTSPLTGEAVPRSVRAGDTVLSGMINKTGMLEIVVTRLFNESSVAKILDLVENASSKKAETEKFITKFARYYTPVVVFGAMAVALFPPLLLAEATFADWIYRALVLLVISCPCALVISIPVSYFGGVGGASKRGILVKGANFLDALSKVKTVVFDKTGTLTKGVFKVTQIVPEDNFSSDELIRAAAEAEVQSNHPIAHSIMEAYGGQIDPSTVQQYEEIAGRGIKAIVRSRRIVAGNDRLLHQEKIDHGVCDVEGTVIHVAIDNEYAGYIVIADELKEDTPNLIRSLRAVGVGKVIMLTGDEVTVAGAVAKKLDLDAYHADLLPEEKVEVIEELLAEQDRKGKLAFVGDGINDAPVIARADVGVAMGALGSDAAIETADVVIMTDRPSKIVEAIRMGKKTHWIVWQNIIMALGVKGAFIFAGLLGVATMWEAVFADVGVALIAVFNATRSLNS